MDCIGNFAVNVRSGSSWRRSDRPASRMSTTILSRSGEVMAMFDGFFKVRRNVILEIARFNPRCQREGESAEQYITALYGLVETCEYGNLRDETRTFSGSPPKRPPKPAFSLSTESHH